MNQQRVWLDANITVAKSSGYFVRNVELKKSIERIEARTSSVVIGLVYDGENTIELILDPPLGDEEE